MVAREVGFVRNIGFRRGATIFSGNRDTGERLYFYYYLSKYGTAVEVGFNPR